MEVISLLIRNRPPDLLGLLTHLSTSNLFLAKSYILKKLFEHIGARSFVDNSIWLDIHIYKITYSIRSCVCSGIDIKHAAQGKTGHLLYIMHFL